MKVNISNNKLLRLIDLISLTTPQSRVLVFSLVILILSVLPTDQLYLLPIRSIYQTFLGWQPYSSGMTRSISYILHGHFDLAWQMNSLGFLVFGVAGVIYLKDVYKLFKQAKKS